MSGQNGQPRLRAAYFDSLYRANPDPWNYQLSRYESEKYAATVAALPRRFTSGLEVGCSIGVLTALLAAHVDDLLAVDVSSVAIASARDRVPDVRFECRELPEDFPPGRFELIVFSEVLYYLNPAALGEMLDAVDVALTGSLLAVHRRRVGPGFQLAGAEVHERLAHRFGKPAHSATTPRYLLDRFDRAAP